MDIKNSSELDFIISVLYLKVMGIYKNPKGISYIKIFDCFSQNNKKHDFIQFQIPSGDHELFNEFFYEKKHKAQPDDEIITRLLNIMSLGSNDSFLRYHIIRSNFFKLDVLRANGRELIGGHTPWLKGSPKSDCIYNFLTNKIEKYGIVSDAKVINKITREAISLFKSQNGLIISERFIQSGRLENKKELKERWDLIAEDNNTGVKIYWGTNRASEKNDIELEFTDERNNNSSEQLRVGCSYITIPKNHEVGVLERPKRWFGLFNKKQENINEHIVIHASEIMSRTDWVSAFTNEDNEDEGLLFIHGYNCSFDNALYRAAQLKYDLKFNGTTFSFNWASRGKVMRYNSDEETIRWSKHHLEELINLILSNDKINKLHIVAHSMGNRALIDLVDKWPEGMKKVHTLILAAPDVDVDIMRKIEANFSHYNNVTLYSSDTDLAISTSAFIHDHKRAGNSQPPCVFNNIETIDVSEIKKPIFSLGHSYYAETLKVFTDMYYLIRNVPVLQRVNIHQNAELNYYFIK